MARTIVGVLRGGTSSEYNLSLKSGARVLQSLPEERYDARDLFVDKRGFWHSRGMPVDAARALSQVDVVINALHGGAGEDGTVQRILERAGVPYTGSRPLASSLSLNKIRARDVMRKAGVRVPLGVWYSLNDRMNTAQMAQGVFAVFGPPYVVKPAMEGAGRGVRFAQTLVELPDAIADVLDEFGFAIVEEFVRGREATVGIIEGFRGEELYALPPVHIELPEGSRFITPDHHENALLRHNVPSSFTHDEKNMLMDAARSAHRALGLSHFSRADIILTPRAAYVLEVNSVPGIYPGAAMPAMLESVGSSVPEYLEHAIELSKI